MRWPERQCPTRFRPYDAGRPRRLAKNRGLQHLSSLPLLALPLAAQSTLHVGPGQTYADIPAAVAAAAPGDRVLVAAGNYSPFDLDKGITIRADPIGAVVDVILAGTPIACAVPAGQQAYVEGLTLRSPITVDLPANATAAGVVSLVAVDSYQQITVTDATLALRDCWVSGSVTDGISLLGNANLSAVQCEIRGGNFGSPFVPPPRGIGADGNSKLLLGDCAVFGGISGFVHSVTGVGNGVELFGNATAWFVDSTLQAVAGSHPAIGLLTLSTVPVTLERTQVLDNTGAGQAWQGAVQTGLLLGVSSTTPLARGTTFQLAFHTRPGLPVLVHVAFGLGGSITAPFLVQPDFGFVSASFPIAVLIGDPQGQAGLSLPLPNSAAIQDLPLWFRAWTELALPVQLSPVLGGLVR